MNGAQSQVLSLYRNLLSLTRAPKSEPEVVRFVVESLHEIFPTFRISFSNVDESGRIHILHSRGPMGTPDVTGASFDISSHPKLLKALFELRTLTTSDVRTESLLEPLLNRIRSFSPALSRMDVPFDVENGVVRMLTVSSTAAGAWPPETTELVHEAGAMLRFVFRELRTQAKLRETETIFRQFAENVGVVFWMTDVSKNEMVYVSPAYEQLWGRSVESFYAEPRSFVDAIHPDDRRRVLRELPNQALGPYEQEYRVVKPSGEVRWVKDRGFPVKDESGKVARVVGIAEDITPLREARERLEASRNQMAANAKFAALGEMASGIAHEINNPLAVIHGLAVQMQELVRREGKKFPAEMAIDSFESIEKMSNRIAGIVKGLRTFSRQTSADPLVPADLNAILTETMAMCTPKLRAANVKLEVDRPASPLGIHCRSSEISQVILNLLNNAVDAVTGTEERRIRIEVVQRESGVARLVVQDSGSGIRPDLKERIFQPFFTTKEVGKGTGLGLSISKSIIEAHGGKLFLDPAAQGARFVVELPSE